MTCSATIRRSIACRRLPPSDSDSRARCSFRPARRAIWRRLMAHCGRGDEFLVGQEAHTYKYEQGGAAVLGSIQPQPLEHEPMAASRSNASPRHQVRRTYHFARTRLLALENTIGGRVLPLDYLRRGHRVCAFARACHASGRRAPIQCHRQARKSTSAAPSAGFDSVSVCLSKGLGAPAGSILMGSRELIAAARRWRKALGGGMRQAGVLARGGTVCPGESRAAPRRGSRECRISGRGIA